MAQNNFFVDLIAALQKVRSKKQIQSDIKSLENDLPIKLTGQLDISKTRKNIKRQLKGLNISITPTINAKDAQNATNQAVNAAQKFANNHKIRYSFEMDKQKLQNQLTVFSKQNSRLFSSKEMTAKYNQLVDSASIAKSKTELNALRQSLSAFRTELVSVGKAGMTWIDRFKASISHFAQYFSGASFIYAMTYQLRNAWTEAKTLDDSLVNLMKVTDEIENRDSLYKYLDKAMNKAQELNVKVGSLIDAVTEFKKLGWSLSDAELGAEWATILENVGDVDIETAIGSIKTSIASFDKIGGYGNDQMDKKLEAYVDLINNMSNKYSIDAEGLAEAVRLSAGTLTEAHTGIEEAVTMFSTANKYYNDPSYLGNTAKIGSLRMRATTGDKDAINELSEMGEDVEEVTALTGKLREELLDLAGVDIMSSNNTFKSYYQQLKEISQVIDDLDDTSRAKILETMFGKNRAAAGVALLSGMQQSATAYQDAINSAGSATQEYTSWLGGANAATQRFSNNLVMAYQQIINGNTVRDLANFGSALLEFSNKFGIIEGTLKSFLALKIGQFLTTSTMAFLSATKQVEQYGKALKMANNIPNGNLSQRFSMLKGIAQATSSLTDAQLKHVLSSKSLSQQDRIRILRMRNMSREMALQKLSEMNLTNATNRQTAANVAQTTSIFSLKAAMTGLGQKIKGAFLSNKVGIILMAIGVGLSAITTAISNSKQKLEEARQKAIELTDSYKEQQSALDSQIEKYKELKETLDNGNISTDEARSIKEQLLEIQKSLIDSYGDEASNIDLVNGKYKEQLGLLGELSKEKATDFITENRDVYADAKEALEKVRTYDVGNVVWTNKSSDKEDKQKLVDYLKSYSDLLDLTESGGRYGNEISTSVNLSVKANVANADDLLHQLAEDLEKYGKDNNVDVSGLLEGISGQLKNTWTDELKEYKTVYDEFMKAEIVRNDTLRPLYQQSIKAVEDYNNALSTGEGVKTAKANLDSLQQSVKNATGELEGSQDIFDGIYDGINKNAEAAYNLDQSFKSDKTVQKYAEQLRGLSDIDLESINLDNANTEKGEKAFKGLMETLGLTKEQAQSLIDKLIELGYVQGSIQDSESGNEPSTLSLSDWLSSNLPGDDKKTWSDAIDDYQTKISKLSELSTKLKEATSMDDLESSDIIDLAQDFGITGDSIEELRQEVENAMDLNYDSLVKAINEILKDQPEDSPTYKAFKNLEEQIKRTHDEAVKAARDSSQSLKGLSTMKGGIGSIVSAYNEKKESKYNTVSANTLNSMYDTLGIVEWDEASQKAWDNYINYAASGKSTLKELKVAQDELATAYVNSNSFLKDLNESNKEAYITMLKEMGVKNANEVVTQALTNKEENLRLEKILLTNTSKDFQSATANDIEQLQTLGMVSETEVERIAILALQKQFCNNNVINTEADCENVYRLAKMAGASVDALSKLEALKARLGEKVLSNTERENISNKINEIVGEVEDSAKTKINIPQVNVNPSAQSNDSSSSKDSKKDTKEIFDWIERRINKLKKAFDKWNKQAEESMNPKRISAYYKLAGNELKKLLSTEQKAYSYYKNKANSVGLDESYASKVRNGSIEIDTIKNEKLIDKIQEYQKWYDKMVEMSDNFLEDVQKIYDIPSQKREQLVERFETRNDILEGREENAIGYKKKNKILTKEKKNAKGIYNTYVNAQKETQTNLNSAKKDLVSNGLTKSSKIAKAVKNGKEIDLSGLKENSSAYNYALKYNEALRANKTATDELATATNEYRSKLRELQAEKFNNITDHFQNVIGLMDNKMDDLDNKISDIESRGKIAGAKLYDRQIVVQENIGKKLAEEEKILKERIKHTKKGTDEYYEQKEAIQQIQNEQAEVNAKIHEMKQAINEVADTIRENIIGSFHDMQDEMDLLNTLLGDNLTDNDTGDFTKEGRASLLLFKDQMDISKKASSSYLDDINRLQKAIENGNYSKFTDSNDQTYEFASREEALDKLKEFNASYREEVKKYYDYENSMIDLVKQKYEAESEYLSKLIDKKKELLDTEKDIHDYSKNIKEQTDNINSLQKQISALSSDDSVETNARVQKLKSELKKSRETLKNDEYEKYISDQQSMLDNLIKEHDTLVTNLEKDRDALLKEGNRIIEEYGTEAVQTINDVADKYDYQMTSQTSSVVNKMDELGNVLNEIRDAEKERVTAKVPETTPDNTPPKTTDEQFKANMINTTAAAVASTMKNSTTSAVALPAMVAGSLVSALTSDGAKEASQKAQSSLKKMVSSLPFSGVTKKLFGFSKGGVVDVKDAIKANGDEILVSASDGERILTPVQNEMWEKWTDNFPNLMNMAESLQMKSFSPVTDIPNIQKRDGMGVSYGGGNNIQITLPDVRNYEDFMQKFQKDPNAEKLVCHMAANAMSNNTSRLGKFNQRF